MQSSTSWPTSKCCVWWLLKELIKKLQTSSQPLKHRSGTRRKLFAFLYAMLHISPAGSFQFAEEAYTAPQMVSFNHSSSQPEWRGLAPLPGCPGPAQSQREAAPRLLPASTALGSQGLISQNPLLKLVNDFHMYPCVRAGGAPRPAALVITLDYL